MHPRSAVVATVPPMAFSPLRSSALFVVALVALASAARSQGADDCASAHPIAGNVTTGFSTVSASTDGPPHTACIDFPGGQFGRDVWFRWTATMTGSATVSTCGGTSLDTLLAAYAGAACPAGILLDCDDDSCGFQSRVGFACVAGREYLIRVGTLASIDGTGQLVIGQSPTIPGMSAYCLGVAPVGCPCGNLGSANSGCGNSANATGARLGAVGFPSVLDDTLVLVGSGMTDSSAVYFQGTSIVNMGLGTHFGDGLRCASGFTIRLGTRLNAGGTSRYPEVGDPSISVRGGIAAGNQRRYQVLYRDAATFCTPATFNLTNGLTVLWHL